MKKIVFWEKVSNYSMATNLLLFIILFFFKKHIHKMAFPIICVGIFSILIYLVSEIVKFRLKKSRK